MLFCRSNATSNSTHDRASQHQRAQCELDKHFITAGPCRTCKPLYIIFTRPRGHFCILIVNSVLPPRPRPRPRPLPPLSFAAARTAVAPPLPPNIPLLPPPPPPKIPPPPPALEPFVSSSSSSSSGVGEAAFSLRDQQKLVSLGKCDRHLSQ